MDGLLLMRIQVSSEKREEEEEAGSGEKAGRFTAGKGTRRANKSGGVEAKDEGKGGGIVDATASDRYSASCEHYC